LPDRWACKGEFAAAKQEDKLQIAPQNL